MDIQAYNRRAWNHQVKTGNEWTRPVSAELTSAAAMGKWDVLLTGEKPVPKSWFPELKNLQILGLASGGGQQGPILAAAGAKVTIFDNSPEQLEQDKMVAQRDGLKITTVLGDMTNLAAFEDASFDLVFNPCSVCFVQDVGAVWREAYRVLKPGGWLLSGFIHPMIHIFDEKLAEKGELKIRHRLPYSDLVNLTEAERNQLIADQEPFIFGHSLEQLIGSQTEAGFAITGLYEDGWKGKAFDEFMPSFIATRALKPKI